MRRLKGFEPSVLSPALDEARLTREYAVIRERTLGRPRARAPRRWARPVMVAAALASLVVLLAFAWQMPFRTPKMTDGAVLVAGGSEVRVALPEGSSVELAAHTRARLTRVQLKAIRIDVETGSVDVEATHVEGRSFTVGVGLYEVRVTGTHFRVERIPGKRVSVRVDEGVVEVASAGATERRLGAGEEWSAPDGPVALEPPPSEVPTTDAPASSVPAPLAPQAAAPSVVAAPSAPASLASPTSPTSPTSKGGGGAMRDAANELFQEAQRARAEGRVLDAARAFDKVRRTYRKDPRAPIAAFELGRLRLDVLQDPVGAEEALHDAVVLGPTSPLREDAEARRVEALSRAGDRVGCTAARDAYLARWPSGTYRRTVELYCSK